MSTASTPRTAAEALALIATHAAKLECTIDVERRTVTYDSQIEQDDVTEDVPGAGFLVFATFPSEKYPEMAGQEMHVQAVENRLQVRDLIHSLLFDWAPMPAWGVDVFDLTTGDPVEYTVVRSVQVSGVDA